MKVEGVIKNGNDTNGLRPLSVDKISRLLTQIHAEHAAVHDGIHYIVEDFISIADSGTASIIIETPFSPVAHFIYEVYTTGGSCDIELKENAVANATGTLITPKNNNRISINTSSLVFRLNPTGLVDGTTVISRTRIGSGTTPSTRSGGNLERDKEIILKPSTKYQIKLTNQAGAANIVGWIINYYEYESYN